MKRRIASSILSVPSWVVAGSYAENLHFLADKNEVQGVELLFFLYDKEIQALLDAEWDELLRYRERFVFTAHLPDLLRPAHGELVSRLAPLVRHYIVHPAAKNPAAQARLLAQWTERYGASFLVENTQAGLLEALLPHLSANDGLCMDTGHLLLEGHSPADFYTRHSERIREIHLHGVDRAQAALDGKLADHRRLREGDPWLPELLPLLEEYRGILNLEVFSWEEARAGIEILQKEPGRAFSL
jgi:sugar phosphate isomerase/epimerase